MAHRTRLGENFVKSIQVLELNIIRENSFYRGRKSALSGVTAILICTLKLNRKPRVKVRFGLCGEGVGCNQRTMVLYRAAYRNPRGIVLDVVPGGGVYSYSLLGAYNI
jgi:hypothetical protein